jgi:F-type H+-transporting ATPase subunit b
MLIDWFTVAAQALNFLILVWLMKRFLYQPVLLAIDTREKKIAADIADAATKLAAAQKQESDFRAKSDAFDQQRAGLLRKATDDAAAEKQRLLDEARKAADALGAKRKAAQSDEEQSLAQSIAKRTGEEVFATARKALTALASASLEDRIVEVFIERLRGMTGTAKDELGEALKALSGPAVLRSAFDLPAPQRLSIEAALSEIFAAKIPLRYEIAPELVGGLDLCAGGRKIGWSIADYLSSLEKSQPVLVSQ